MTGLPRARRGLVVGAIACAVVTLVGGCSRSTTSGAPSTTSGAPSTTSGAPSTTPVAPSGGPGGGVASSSSPAVPIPDGWVDQEVSFTSGGVTINGTFRRPQRVSAPVPAVLLIAGSGPTDRNGNTRLLPGATNTLLNLAGVLADDGVASLRYDKLGSGTTGIGPYAAHPDTVGLDVFTDEARAALTFLAARPGVDDGRLSVYGHSEGALFALLLATGTGTPHVHSVALLEPLSRRYLDIITEQVTAQVDQQRAAGLITAQQGTEVTKLLAQAVSQLRSKGTVPPDMGYGLGTLFAPSSLLFLREADRIDPATLAAKLPAGMPVLITCSDADIQVSCSDVEHLAGAVRPASLDFVHLHGVDHVLKQDASRTAKDYGEALPFSAQLVAALRSFVTR